jgi:cytochrome P450
MSPSFSHGSVAKSHKYLVESFIDLAARLTTRGYDRPVDLNYFCRCLPADVICKLAYGQTNVIAAADDDFHTPVLDTFDENAASIWLRAYYPYIRYAQDNLIPFGLGSRLSPAIRRVRAFHILAHSNVRAFREGRSSIPDIKPIISMVADMPDEVVSRNAVVLLAAGSDTTGMTLAYACWQILQNPQLLERLLAEVDPLFDAAAPHMPDMSVLETAPLLSALVKESLRCAMAVPGRLPRIVPENAKTPLVVDGQLVPAGTVVGMSAYTCHTDTEVWGPDAREFNPDRWLGPDSTAKFSDVMTFGKGVRSCLGQPLAMAELAMGLAFFFRTYHMELQRGSDAWETFDRFTYLLTTPFYVKMSLRREVVVAA